MRDYIGDADRLPLYIQIKQTILENIDSKQWKLGSRIPSERDLAKEFGVSQMTVNRALQDLARAGILKREVGRGTFVCKVPTRLYEERRVYVAHFSPLEWIGQAEYSQSIFSSMHVAAKELNISLTLGGKFQSTMTPGDAHGIIVIAPSIDKFEELKECHEKSPVPLVVVGAHWPNCPFYCVDSDNFQGAYQGTSHLLSLGHRRIGILIGATDQCNVRDRIAGYRQALRDAEMETHGRWMINIDDLSDAKENERIVLEAVDCHPRPTAFVAVGYHYALELMRILGENHMNIPGDISLVGYDNPYSAAYLNPPLTTLEQPLTDMGHTAICLLNRLIDGKEEEKKIHLLPGGLIIRASTAKPYCP
jgi:GntR family transcriptional regulator of arabinose operon